MPDDVETLSTSEARPMLLTVKDLEGELQLGRTRTYELVRSGVIPVIRIGRAGSGWPDAGLVRPVCCAV